jgi:ATP-binding cassette subfamily C (CFTR/MRP) protein 1
MVALVGQVGSGKSSVLAAVLGDMAPAAPAAPAAGGGSGGGQRIASAQCLAYVPQRAWLASGTIAENVTMGAAMGAPRFEAALRDAAMGADMAQLPAGAATEVGERGTTLSGGQQQRLAIARALYKCSRPLGGDGGGALLLLDDPLAAVDPAVAKEIFGNLRRRCYGEQSSPAEQQREFAPISCLMALNQLQFLPQFDRVLVLHEGRVVEEGTPAQLLARGPGGAYAQLQSLSLRMGADVDAMAPAAAAEGERAPAEGERAPADSAGEQPDEAGAAPGGGAAPPAAPAQV